MTLKRRIFIANTGMVMVSLLILLGFGALLIEIFKDEFLGMLGQNTTLADYTYEVQRELLNLDSYREDWDGLSEKLAEYDYELYVSDSQCEKVFSNVRHSEMECIEELEKMKNEKNKVLLTNMEGITIIRIHAAKNLEEKINYTRKDEFYDVCSTFDEMQLHLKDGIEKTAAYEKARTEMISGISHDLRTPLTAMKAFLKGIMDGVANTSEKREEYIRISYQKTCDMERLLQKLFFFSKLETGNMQIQSR